MKRILISILAFGVLGTANADDVPQIIETEDCPVSDFAREQGPSYLEALGNAVSGDKVTPVTFLVLRVSTERTLENPDSLGAIVEEHLKCRNAETALEFLNRKSDEFSAAAEPETP